MLTILLPAAYILLIICTLAGSCLDTCSRHYLWGEGRGESAGLEAYVVCPGMARRLCLVESTWAGFQKVSHSMQLHVER